jgi:CheY-like chemotaxis protein
LTYLVRQVTFAISPLRRGKNSLARKILLADDSVTAQNMGRKILADAGYEVITVNNGSAALKKIAELKPDLVILDVYMPGYSGLEVCQRLKESQDSSRIPVLLTVGKLEPFKPEEAHRVRAEGFIVKPFEASELLSALSKLEDKVVPRAESSKPGRFARTIAAVDEASRIARNDNSADDGWKSRIAFPHQKTAEEKIDEDSSYNPVNRDLRTVVERPAEKSAEQAAPNASHIPETSLDVAALAPPGFPQDVTPEEVAAIAAAAAQIQMAATMRDAHPSSHDESSKEISTEVSAEGSGTEQPTPAMTPVPAQIAAAADKSGADYGGAPQSAELNRDSDISSEDIPSEESQDVPMTMAAATQSIAAGNGNSSQWTAVAVALDADEAMISLEQEMQKAYAAFVSEESASRNAITAPEISVSQNSPVRVEATAETSASAASSLEPEPMPQPEPVSESASSAASNSAMEPSADAAGSSADAGVAQFPQSSASTQQLESISPERAANESVEASAAESYESSESKPEPAPEPVSAVPAIASAAEELPPTPPEVATVETTTSNQASAPRSEDIEAAGEQGHKKEQEEKEAEEEIKEDPETVRTTAAAWASWRQIRDTDDAKPEAAEAAREPFDAPASALAESAAMAVAAGAEQNVQESTTPTPEKPSDVASIVDSVLADLRPRLMAEITRKMSEKK